MTGRRHPWRGPLEVALSGKLPLKLMKNVVWWCRSLTFFEVAHSAAMGLESRENVVGWCSSLTLRVFDFSMEMAKAQLRNWRCGV